MLLEPGAELRDAVAAGRRRIRVAQALADATLAAFDMGATSSWSVAIAEARVVEAERTLEELLRACAEVSALSGPMSVGAGASSHQGGPPWAGST